MAQGDTEPPPPEASLIPISGTDYEYFDVGEDTKYSLILKNEGDFRETFIIEVNNDYNWDVTVNDATVPIDSILLDAGESQDITINIDLPSNTEDGHYWLNVTVKSRGISASELGIDIIVSDQGVVISSIIKPVLVIRPFKEQLGTISPGETIELKLEVRCYLKSTVVHLEVETLKKLGFQLIPERNLTVTTDSGRVIEAGNQYDFTLTIELSKSFDRKADYTCQLRIKPINTDKSAVSRPVSVFLVVRHAPSGDNSINYITHPITLSIMTTVLTIGAIGGVIGSHEAGKYWLLSVLFIPLYTKLHKNKILDHFTRGRVYEYIRNNPGTYYSEIKRELELNNGNLTYHLHTLEREALIKSRTKGRFKVFYPMDVKIPTDMEPEFSGFRTQLLDLIREHPGISQKELGALLPNKKQRTISYHIKNMEREGVLRLEKVGRETKCYITNKVLDMKTDSESESKDSEVYSNQYIENDSIMRQI
jgi:predicted transcriptional regulator